MSKNANIDYGKLLGFETVSDHFTGKIDFQDETIGARLGAKVGAEAGGVPAAYPKMPLKFALADEQIARR
jgi:hypothetical protein